MVLNATARADIEAALGHQDVSVWELGLLPWMPVVFLVGFWVGVLTSCHRSRMV